MRTRRGAVRVVTTSGEFEAGQVLITLPLGVLKAGSVRFVPELPAAKREAIKRLGMGTAGHRGVEIEGWSDEAIVEDAMRTLRIMHGDDIPDPLDAQITRWHRDPFARGAYSFNALGATPATRDALAAPLEGALFFAGEATERNDSSTTHGAYLSGVRVAREMGTK